MGSVLEVEELIEGLLATKAVVRTKAVLDRSSCLISTASTLVAVTVVVATVVAMASIGPEVKWVMFTSDVVTIPIGSTNGSVFLSSD